MCAQLLCGKVSGNLYCIHKQFKFNKKISRFFIILISDLPAFLNLAPTDSMYREQPRNLQQLPGQRGMLIGRAFHSRGRCLLPGGAGVPRAAACPHRASACLLPALRCWSASPGHPAPGHQRADAKWHADSFLFESLGHLCEATPPREPCFIFSYLSQFICRWSTQFRSEGIKRFSATNTILTLPSNCISVLLLRLPPVRAELAWTRSSVMGSRCHAVTRAPESGTHWLAKDSSWRQRPLLILSSGC